MKKIIIIFLSFISTSYSQNYEFGKVSLEELQEKTHQFEPDAAAAYLYKKRKTFYNVTARGFETITEIHERIKIYNKEGFFYATKQIFLNQNGNTKEKVSDIKAYTYSVVNKDIIKHELDKSAIFDEKTTDYLQKKSFTMPNVAEGSIVEFSYTITSPFFFNITPFSFQSGIPINKIDAYLESPRTFKYRPTYKGYLNINTRNYTANNSKIRDVVNITEFKMLNVPSLRDEAFVDNINNYRSSVTFELMSIDIPGRMHENFNKSWEDVTKTIYKSSKFGSELGETNYFKEDLNTLLQGAVDEKEKMTLIYDFVKSSISWNNYRGYRCYLGVKKAYNERKGNVADINLMLTAMLRYAGINANPVLLSTKPNGIPVFPTTNGFDYVICAAKINNEMILLDATNKLLTPNILPKNAINWMGRLIKENGVSIKIDLTPSLKSLQVFNVNVDINEKGFLEGKVRGFYTHYDAFNLRDSISNSNKEKYLEKLESKYSGIEINDFELENEEEVAEPVIENYNFNLDYGVEIISDKIYFSPMLFFAEKENPFKLEKREYPIDFVYPQSKKYIIDLTIPDGYKIETLPKGLLISLPDNMGKFSYNLFVDKQKVRLITSTEINKSVIPALYYEALKEYYSNLVQKENEKIVLIKEQH